MGRRDRAVTDHIKRLIMETEEFAGAISEALEFSGSDAHPDGWEECAELIRLRDAEQRKAGALAALEKLDPHVCSEAMHELRRRIELGEWKP
jgi:hypothetical protein